MGMNVALRAWVGVFPPRAADPAGSFDDCESGETGFFERDTHAQTRHASAEDDNARGKVFVGINVCQVALIESESTTLLLEKGWSELGCEDERHSR